MAPATKAPRERYIIEVEMLPSGAPSIPRLKAALKTLLRQYRMRAVTCVPAPTATQEARRA